MAVSMALTVAADAAARDRQEEKSRTSPNVQVGPRPYYLVEKLEDGPLKRTLEHCAEMDFRPTRFSIGHRGAPLQLPENTKESYQAAARMGAGLIECDVTFTKDTQLVCRHAQCDLHLTTDILGTDLAGTCVEPFAPAQFDSDSGERIRAASAKCCTSDVTLAEFKSLCGRMDGSNPDATTLEGYMAGTPGFRTDLYSACGTLLSHEESIALIGDLGAAGISPDKVRPQSFDLADVRYWLDKEPSFGRQAVLLDARPYEDPHFAPSLADFERLAAAGVRIVAPPLFVLVELDASGSIVPSLYGKFARAAGIDIIPWSFERSGRLREDVKGGGLTGVKKEGSGGTFFYQTTLDAIEGDGHLMETLHVLASQVGVIGVFSDWPGTVTYYAGCMGLD
jgi:glycerophosphoryl diester phosphodiesterase